MKNVIVEKLNCVHNFKSDYQEDIPVRSFEEINLDENLKVLTSTRVDQIIDNYWSPNGFIAWNLAADKTLQMILFKGKAAVITEFFEDDLTVKELLMRASSVGHLEGRRVISACV